jgi:hypothetical protein
VENNKMDVGDIGWGDMNCTDLAQGREFLNAVSNLHIP